MNTAIVPVKELTLSKSRLLPELSRGELEALALAMAEDVLAALLETPQIDRVAVVTPDDRVAAAARQLGAEALHGPDPGLNEAIEAAGPQLGVADEAPLLVVLGDVAGAESADFSHLFQRLAQQPQGPAAILAPSRDGGTSALLRRPARAFPACFGQQSARRHQQAASDAGVPLEVIELASLAIDLDEAHDVEQFVEAGRAGLRTRSLLDQLGWSPINEGDPR